jgi:hypothetical protein
MAKPEMDRPLRVISRQPAATGIPSTTARPVIKDGEIVTRTFPFLVTEMRVAPQ